MIDQKKNWLIAIACFLIWMMIDSYWLEFKLISCTYDIANALNVLKLIDSNLFQNFSLNRYDYDCCNCMYSIMLFHNFS